MHKDKSRILAAEDTRAVPRWEEDFHQFKAFFLSLSLAKSGT